MLKYKRGGIMKEKECKKLKNVYKKALKNEQKVHKVRRQLRNLKIAHYF